MTPQEAIDFFGGGSKLAKAIRTTPAAPSLWKKAGYIPYVRQCQIQVITKGKLKADLPEPESEKAG